MRFKCGDKIVNKVTGETYIVSNTKKLYVGGCEGYVLSLRKKSHEENILIDKNMIDILFKLDWTSWKWGKIEIFGEKVPVKWRHNGDLTVMESQKYGKVSSKVHPDDTFNVDRGYNLCKLRMIKKILDDKINEYYK